MAASMREPVVKSAAAREDGAAGRHVRVGKITSATVRELDAMLKGREVPIAPYARRDDGLRWTPRLAGAVVAGGHCRPARDWVQWFEQAVAFRGALCSFTTDFLKPVQAGITFIPEAIGFNHDAATWSSQWAGLVKIV